MKVKIEIERGEGTVFNLYKEGEYLVTTLDHEGLMRELNKIVNEL